MSDETLYQQSSPAAWLVELTAGDSARSHPIHGRRMRIGREPGNEIIPQHDKLAAVSKRHLEIRKQGGSYRVCDLGSTNGTYLNGRPIQEAELVDGAIISLGPDGPQFRFCLGSVEPAGTVKNHADETGTIATGAPSGQDEMIENAIRMARAARQKGVEGQTGVFVREAVRDVVRRSRRGPLLGIVFLLLVLIAVSVYAYLTIQELKGRKLDLDQHIARLEVQLRESGDPNEVEHLIQELEGYQNAARDLQKGLLYQLGVRSEEEDFIHAEIRRLMAELGAEDYSIPPEFSERVRFYIQRFQQRDRRNMERALFVQRQLLNQIQQQLADANLPSDLAFMTVVESAFRPNSVSEAGAAGLWQMVPRTARSLGLTVNEEVDERFDVTRSTEAAARYLRRLILEFGAGSSVMLAMAAYNLGPTRIRRVLRKVEDPIRQRNFWYLYRTRALPAETRSYVPKVIASIIIGRNPERLGFSAPAT